MQPIRPDSETTIDMLIAMGIAVSARCQTCEGSRYGVDLQAIREKFGGDYKLWNRMTACKITPGCRGRAYFRFKWSMWDYDMGEDFWRRIRR